MAPRGARDVRLRPYVRDLVASAAAIERTRRRHGETTRQRVGIESRLGADGKERHRARGVRGTGRGPWRSSLAAARSDQARLVARRDAGAFEPSEFPTLGEALDTFLDGAEQGRPWARGGRPFAPKTVRGYRQDSDLWIEPTLGTVPVDRLRRSQIQELVDEVAAVRSGQTARKVATVLQTLYRHLLPRHDELNDPTVGLELPAGSEPRDVIVTPVEMTEMRNALALDDQPAFALACIAGLRAGEMKGARVEDVILVEFGETLPTYWHGARVEDCARIIVRSGWDEVEGRKSLKHRRRGESRAVPIFAPLRPLVETQLRSLGPDVRLDYPLLPGKGAQGSRIGRGIPLDTDGLLSRCRLAWGWKRGDDRRGWERARRDALGPDGFRLHDARHSFASHLILAGFDVATVAEWIGHRQASTTLDRYVKPLRQRGVSPAAVRAYLGVEPERVS